MQTYSYQQEMSFELGSHNNLSIYFSWMDGKILTPGTINPALLPKIQFTFIEGTHKH